MAYRSPLLASPRSFRRSFAESYTEVAKVALGPILNGTLEPRAITLTILGLDTLQVPWLPVETDQATREQLGSILGRLGERLMKQKCVTNRTVEHAVEDMCQRLALSRESCQYT